MYILQAHTFALFMEAHCEVWFVFLFSRSGVLVVLFVYLFCVLLIVVFVCTLFSLFFIIFIKDFLKPLLSKCLESVT